MVTTPKQRKPARQAIAVLLACGLSLLTCLLVMGCAGLPLDQQGQGQPFYENWKTGVRNPWFCHGLLYHDKPLASRTSDEPTLESLVLFGEGQESAQVKVVLIVTQKNPGKNTFDYLIYHYPNHLQLPQLHEHWRVRTNSPYFAPLKMTAGGKDLWFVLTGRYPLAGTWKSSRPHSVGLKAVSPPYTQIQLEIYEQDPRAGFTLPLRTWVVGEAGENLQMYSSAVWSLGGGLFTIADMRVGSQFNLEKLELVSWTPPPPETILAGYAVRAETEALLAIGKALNQRLLEWKTKELAEGLPGYTKAQLQDWVVKLESALLELDTRVKKVKDAQDEAARYLPQPGQAQPAPLQVPQWKVDQATLFTQRKAIVMACLEMAKKALAQKRGSN